MPEWKEDFEALAVGETITASNTNLAEAQTYNGRPVAVDSPAIGTRAAGVDFSVDLTYANTTLLMGDEAGFNPLPFVGASLYVHPAPSGDPGLAVLGLFAKNADGAFVGFGSLVLGGDGQYALSVYNYLTFALLGTTSGTFPVDTWVKIGVAIDGTALTFKCLEASLDYALTVPEGWLVTTIGVDLYRTPNGSASYADDFYYGTEEPEPPVITAKRDNVRRRFS